MILERLQDSRFSRVLPSWKGCTVVLLAGGPSLTREDFATVAAARDGDRVRVIAINDSYLLAPWADAHYAADSKWHRWHTEGIAKPVLGLAAVEVRERWAGFAGEKCTVQNSGGNVPDDAVHVLRNKTFPVHGKGISLDPEALVTGRHGGFQALNLAILAGAARVLLLGYDARRGESGEPHWHGDHPIPSPCENAYPAFRQAFIDAQDEIAATGAHVVNCSMVSRIDTFPKVPLERALEELTP